MLEDIRKDPLYPMMTPRRMVTYLNMTFAAGYGEGSRSRSNRKAVEQYSPDGKLLREFESTADAKRATGIDNSDIVRACQGARPLAGGYVWRYKGEPLIHEL